MANVLVQSRLDASLLEDLERIKDALGIQSGAEVVRFLIRAEARRLENGGGRIAVLVGAYLTEQITAEEAMQAIVSLPGARPV